MSGLIVECDSILNTDIKGNLLDDTKTIDAHIRNSIEIAKYLNYDFASNDKTLCRALKNKYNIICFSYASFYASFNLMNKIVLNNPKAKYYWITNEYNLVPTAPVIKARKLNGITILANYEENNKIKFKYTSWHQLNLNLLLAQKRRKKINKKYDCIYYGTFREDRAKYFKKYFDDIYVSTSSKNYKKIAHLKCKPKYIKKLDWTKGKETLNIFRYSLYIEDEYTHEVFNNMANRFYEALFCNCIVLFDKSCINTLEKAGIKDYKNYIVDNKQELTDKIKECNENFEKHLEYQQEWNTVALKQRANLFKQLKTIFHDN